MFDRMQNGALEKEKQTVVYTYPKMVMSVEEMAEEFGISRPTAYKLVKEKGFPAFNIGQRIFVNRKELQRWVDHQCEIHSAA